MIRFFKATQFAMVFCWGFFVLQSIVISFNSQAEVAAPQAWQQAAEAYNQGHFAEARGIYHTLLTNGSISAELYQNLGNAEWKCDAVGPAILSWEHSFWLDPWLMNARNNLRFARRSALLEEPELNWYEYCSTWLPANQWAAVSSVSFWSALSLILLPGVLGWKRSTIVQSSATFALSVFLLSLPALYGLHTRSQVAVVLVKDCPLQLTPTHGGEITGRLSAGELVRFQGERGGYLRVRTSSQSGWIERPKLGFIAAE